MMKKSDDFQCALLHYRNTPPRGHTYSPAQRMLCCHTRTKLPTSNNILVPKLNDRTTTQRELPHKRATSKLIYDRTVGAEHPTICTGVLASACMQTPTTSSRKTMDLRPSYERGTGKIVHNKNIHWNHTE